MRKYFIFSAIISLFFSACNLAKHDITIDNPKLEDITVTIDDVKYELIGYTNLHVELSNGTYQMTATTADGSIVFDDEVTIDGEGVLNPTGYTYVKWTDIYLEDAAMYDTYVGALNVVSDITVNEKAYNDVDFTVYEGDAFIANTWDFGLDKYWADEVDIAEGESYAVKSKIYRVDGLEEDWGYYGDIDLGNFTDEEFELLLDSLELQIDDLNLEVVEIVE